jgi:hypothetical protein
VPAFKLSVEADFENLIVPALPYARRLEFGGAVSFDVQVATGTTATVPFAPLTTVQSVVIKSSQDVTVKIDTTNNVALKANGILVLSATSLTNLQVQNASGFAAKVDGACFGS